MNSTQLRHQPWELSSLPTRLVLLGMLIAGLSACATVDPTQRQLKNASADEPSRAERVFLYQSRVADSLLDHYPLMDTFSDADPALVEAEAEMTRSCSPLTRAVLAHFEGAKPSLGLRLQVFTTIGECERAAERIDRLLNGGQKLADGSI